MSYLAVPISQPQDSVQVYKRRGHIWSSAQVFGLGVAVSQRHILYVVTYFCAVRAEEDLLCVGCCCLALNTLELTLLRFRPCGSPAL